jgi:hypothetical protein
MTACRRHRWRCCFHTLAFRYLECVRCGERRLAEQRPVPQAHDREWLEGRVRVS